jgi:molybdopterin molybdotransferase
MSPPTEALQRISKLAPLGEVFARIDAIAAPVAAGEIDLDQATGCVLAADVVVAKAYPATAIALRDGWAVAADQVSDAGPYAPVALTSPAWVEVGEAMPKGTDAVLPPDAVTITKAGAEAQSATTPGDGVLLLGADAGKGAVLLRAGERLRRSDVAVLRLAGIVKVSVRQPRVKIFCAHAAIKQTMITLIAGAIDAEGGDARIDQTDSLERALIEESVDAIITIGGTGAGRRDASVKTLARVGRVEMHGFGLSPGETAALGSIGARPVLMLPGRLDAALAVWLVAGRRLIAHLSGLSADEPGIPVTLAKKITSTVSIAEVIPVRRVEGGVEPLASGFFPWNALARADGWILVPPKSEGYAAKSMLEMRRLP